MLRACTSARMHAISHACLYSTRAKRPIQAHSSLSCIRCWCATAWFQCICSVLLVLSILQYMTLTVILLAWLLAPGPQ